MLRLNRLMPVLTVAVTFSVFMTGTAVSHAQINSLPLYLEIGDSSAGDLFSYTPSGFQRLTTYAYNTSPIMSPDGKYLVYGSYALNYVNDNAAGNGRSGSPAINIWLMDTASGQFKRIADQPAIANTPGPGGVRPYIARSDAVWSPDSQSLAWLEDAWGTQDAENDQNDHLMLYNIATGKQTEIYKQPVYAEGCPCSEVSWSPYGLGIVYADNISVPPQWRLLSTAGKVITQFPFDQYPFVTWLNGQRSPTIVTQSELITVNDQVRSKTLPPLEVYSISAPNGIQFRSDAGMADANWSLVVPGQAPLPIGKLLEYAISPDGAMAAYVTDGDKVLHFFDGRQSTAVDLSAIKVRNASPLQAAGLAWSPLAIQIATES